MDGLVEYGEWCREMGRRWVGRTLGWVKVDIYGSSVGTNVQRFLLVALQLQTVDNR